MTIILKLITKYLRNKADGIIIHGKKLKKIVHKQGIPLNKIFINNIGTYNFFKSKSHKKTNKNSILFFGRIKEYKGLDTLIKATNILIPKYKKLKITIAGEGNFKPYKKYLKYPKNFKILNEYINDDKVDELFSEANMIVLPYKDATQSGLMSIVFAYKKPIISTNVGSIPEIIEDKKQGLIIEPNNPLKLSEAIEYLLKNPKKAKQMGLNGYKKLKTELNWDYIAKKTKKNYIEIITK